MPTLAGLAIAIAIFAGLIIGVRWLQGWLIDRQQKRAIGEYTKRMQ